MSEKYGSHADYMGWVKKDAEARQKTIEAALREAFSRFIDKREVEIIVFSGMSAFDLAEAIVSHPLILKPLLAVCNIAGRAIERDLSIKNVDTYSPRLDKDQAKVIAGYIKPFLPEYIEIPSLGQIDKVAFIDKEIRKGKGQWEKLVVECLNKYGKTPYKKRKFFAGKEEFELDAATPEGDEVNIGIDIKRIEARRDIHKRCDEIVNKAAKLKSVYPKGKFGVIVYYPFIEEHINIQSRLRSDNIDGVVFASEAKDSVENAVRLLLSTLGISE